MANNRMYLICNHCLPPGAKEWPRPSGRSYPEAYSDPALAILKWYPCAPWYSMHPESLGERIEKFMEAHMHTELGEVGLENPVRMEYATWVIDMPAIKKREYK